MHEHHVACECGKWHCWRHEMAPIAHSDPMNGGRGFVHVNFQWLGPHEHEEARVDQG